MEGTKKRNDWKKQMTDLELGSDFTDSSEHYGSLRAMRSKLKSDGYMFTFKIGKGLITVKRVK